MNLKDFYLLSKGMVELIEELDPSPHYSTLADHIDNARQNATPDLKAAIDEQVNKIVEINQEFEERLSKKPHALLVLDRVNVSEFMGKNATDDLLVIIRDEAFAGSSSIRNFVDGITTSKNRLNTIVNTINELGLSFEDDTNQALLGIEYTGDYSVENTSELQARLDEINAITRAFARLVNEPRAFENPVIRGLSKSSPLVIDISTVAEASAAIVLLGKAIEWAMDRIEQQYDIRIKKQQLEKEKFSNSDIRRGFDRLEEKQTSESTLKRYAKKLVQECNPSDNGESGARNEIEKDLIQAMKSIVNMVDKGAMIVAYIPQAAVDTTEEETQTDITVNMSMSVKSLKEKQRTLRLLVEQTADEEDEGADSEDENEQQTEE